MLQIYVIPSKDESFFGQKAKKVISSTCKWAAKAIAEGPIFDRFELLGKKEYFIGPGGTLISGKQYAGSILKIKVSEFLKIERISFLKLQDQIRASKNSTLVFQRISTKKDETPKSNHQTKRETLRGNLYHG